MEYNLKNCESLCCTPETYMYCTSTMFLLSCVTFSPLIWICWCFLMITYRLNTFGRKATKALQFHPQGIYLEVHDTAVLSWMISIWTTLSRCCPLPPHHSDIKTQNSNLQMWGAYMMTVLAAVLRIHLCGDLTDCSGHWANPATITRQAHFC